MLKEIGIIIRVMDQYLVSDRTLKIPWFSL